MGSMVEIQATIVKIENTIAWVQASRKPSCSGCSETGCGISLLAGLLGRQAPLYRARNDAGANVGDKVLIGMDEAALLKGTLLLYMLPLVLLFVGAVGGNMLADGALRDIYAAAGAAIGLLLGFAWLKMHSAEQGLEGKYLPVVLSRIGDVPVRVVALEGRLGK